MIFRQYLHAEPVLAASYLLGCVGKGLGAVVDPVDDPEMYVRESEAIGLPLRYVIDTHVHADHVSGGRGLAAATGAIRASNLGRGTVEETAVLASEHTG